MAASKDSPKMVVPLSRFSVANLPVNFDAIVVLLSPVQLLSWCAPGLKLGGDDRAPQHFVAFIPLTGVLISFQARHPDPPLTCKLPHHRPADVVADLSMEQEKLHDMSHLQSSTRMGVYVSKVIQSQAQIDTGERAVRSPHSDKMT